MTEGSRPVTGSYDDLVRRDIAASPKFREALRREALRCIRDGDEQTGRFVLARYLDEADPIDANATG